MFDLYKAHQDATGLDIYLSGADESSEGVPKLHASASIKDGALTLTIANTAADEEAEVCLALPGFATNVTGRILGGNMDAYNDFDAPETVKVVAFDGATLEDDGIKMTMPACSIVELTCR